MNKTADNNTYPNRYLQLCAEYLTIAENDALTVLPNNLNLDEAAAVTEGAYNTLGNNCV